MSGYIFDDKPEDREFRRLQLIEAAADADTIDLLEQVGVAKGWRCLELGAGAGSIARWMGEQVGPGGLVVALDKKTAHLRLRSSPPYRIVEGDVLTAPLDGTVDVLHARYVLIHNKQDEDILKKIRGHVRSGGFAVLEEPDFTSALRLNPDGDAADQRVNEAICRMFVNAGLDPAYGLTLPGKLAAAGFEVQRSRALMHLCPGGAPIARVMAESAIVLRKEYTATGMAADQDIEQYVVHAGDTRRWSVYYSTVSVIAKAV